VPSFTDTSALLKLYVAETGSRWMHQIVLPGGIMISELAITETGAALNRRVWDGTLSRDDALAAWRTFRRDIRTFEVLQINRRALLSAAYLASRSPVLLRTLDAIHLQGALQARQHCDLRGEPAPTFVSADERLLAAARTLNLSTDDPNQHP
jgi:predicted nucleic acid-binding protein